jgi:hypothetical protein
MTPLRWPAGPDPDRWRVPAFGYAALAGAIGIASGFALFSYLWFAVEHADPASLAMGLGIAAIASFIFESLREQIRLSKEDGHHEHPPLTLGRWMSTVTMLLLFELFVVAWHSIAERQSPQFEHLAKAISGMEEAPPWVNLVGLMAVWVIVGAALSGCLSLGITKDERPWLVRCGVGALQGLVGGVVIPLVAVLAVVVLVRFCLALGMMIFDPAAWDAHLAGLDAKVPSPLNILFWPIKVITKFAAQFGPLRPLALIGGFGYLGWYYYQEKEKSFLMNAAVVATIGVFLAPLLFGFEQLLMLLLLAVLVWAVPTMLLGALAPLLAQPSRDRTIWGVAAFLAAALLLGLTWLRLGWPVDTAQPVIWFLVTILVIGGLLVFQLRKVEDCWPVLALTIATLVWTSTVIMHEVTFSGVLKNFHAINAMPAAVRAPEPAPTFSLNPSIEDILNGKSLRSQPPFSWRGSDILGKPLLSPDFAKLLVPPPPRPLDQIQQDVDNTVALFAKMETRLAELRTALERLEQPPVGPASVTAVAKAEKRLKKLARLHENLHRQYPGLAPQEEASEHHEEDQAEAAHDHAAQENPGHGNTAHGHVAHASYHSLLGDLEALSQELVGRPPLATTNAAEAPAKVVATHGPAGHDAHNADDEASAPLRELLAVEKQQYTNRRAELVAAGLELQKTADNVMARLKQLKGELERVPLVDKLTHTPLPRPERLLPLPIEQRQIDLLVALEKYSLSAPIESATNLQKAIAEQQARAAAVRDAALAPFTEAETKLTALTAAIDARHPQVAQEYSVLAAQRLELALACSFGFWATIGLLIGWSHFQQSQAVDSHKPHSA